MNRRYFLKTAALAGASAALAPRVRSASANNKIVLAVMGSLMVIKNNQRAFMINHLIIIIGMVLTGVSTFLFQHEMISAPVWMIFIGLGLYLGYVPFNSIFFDRLIATFKYVSTVGFLIYLADSFGYVGSVGVMLYKEFGHANLSWLNFFIQASYILSVTGSVLMALSLFYFITKFARHKPVV